MRGKDKTNYKGITLVALIVTIVILIILATVTINVTFGDGGLIEQAKLAAEKTANSIYYEEASVSNLVAYLNSELGESEIELPNPEQNEIVNPEPPEDTAPPVITSFVAIEVTENSVTVSTAASDNSSETLKYEYRKENESFVEGGTTYTFTGLTANTQYELEVRVTDEAGLSATKILHVTTLIALPEGWNGDKVKPVESEDNIIVPVPVGYTESTINGEKRVDQGFVIKEGNDGSATSGINEFVWIPVPEISDLYDEANNAGQLWKFSDDTSSKRNYGNGGQEPDSTTYDTSSNLKEAGSNSSNSSQFKSELQTNFNKMIDSVKTYKGFYIGRYETGNLSKTEAVVQKNNTDISNQTWYSMYKLSKTVAANSNITTEMIWGCQWYATLRWMQTSSDSSVVKYVTDPTGKQNEGSKIATGSNTAYKVNNIYDMAGNVYEWTMEVYNNRMMRKMMSVSEYFMGSMYPDEKSSSIGSRVSLYINVE